MAIWAGATQSEAILLLTPSYIKEYGSGKTYSMSTTDDFHTYRIIVQGNNYTIYVDEIEVMSGSTKNWNRDVMYFGDGSGGSGGSAQWSCVSYTTGGAYSPNQLPSTTCQSTTILTCGEGTILDDSTNQCIIDPDVVNEYEQQITNLSAVLEQCRVFLQQLIHIITSELESNANNMYCGLPESSYDYVIRGTDNPDTLAGTPGNDLIFGFDGSDAINGYGGNDCIIGGEGVDIIDDSLGQDICVDSSQDIVANCEILE